MRVIEELRQMGGEALHCWSGQEIGQTSGNFRTSHGANRLRAAKKLWRHTPFGEMAVYGQESRQSGQRFRLFSGLADVRCRGCPSVLERATTDFGADHAFGRTPKKLQGHCGASSCPPAPYGATTEGHAGRPYQEQGRMAGPPDIDGCQRLVGEIDGGTIPIVKADGAARPA